MTKSAKQLIIHSKYNFIIRRVIENVNKNYYKDRAYVKALQKGTFSMVPAVHLSVLAASDSDMDALTALGIDTSKSPDGYDPYSTDNPYGKNTIEISPVYEIYKVGLANGITYPATYSTTSTLEWRKYRMRAVLW
jgi:hypothetical protein